MVGNIPHNSTPSVH